MPSTRVLDRIDAICVRCDEILKRYEAVDSDGGPFNTVLIDDRIYEGLCAS